MTKDQKSSDVLPALAKSCGATVYKNRASPHEPAVAFSPAAWDKFALALAAQKAAPAGFVNAKDLESVKGNFRHMISMSYVAEPYYGVDVPLYLAAPSTPPSEAEQAEAPSAVVFNRVRDGVATKHAMTNYPAFARAVIARWGATLPPASKAEPVAPVVQEPQPFIHKKSGGKYQFVGLAQIQTDVLLGDMAHVTVYRGGDGRLWVRTSNEFVDRFYQEGRPRMMCDDFIAAEDEAGGVLAISPEIYEARAAAPSTPPSEAEQAEAPSAVVFNRVRDGVATKHANLTEYGKTLPNGTQLFATLPPASKAEPVAPPVQERAYQPTEGAVREACDLLTTIRDAAEGWKNQPGGWSGTKAMCERIINLLRYGASHFAQQPEASGAGERVKEHREWQRVEMWAKKIQALLDKEEVALSTVSGFAHDAAERACWIENIARAALASKPPQSKFTDEQVSAIIAEKDEYKLRNRYLESPAEQVAQDSLQGAADWLFASLNKCDEGDLQRSLLIGYNRAERLLRAARARGEGERA